MPTLLKYKSTGTAVQKLKSLLANLGYTIRGERPDYFGRNTEKAIKNLQKAANLEVTGIVDEATATYLGSSLSSRNTGSKRIVSGNIYDKHDRPLTNKRVIAYDKDLRNEQQLGATLSNAQGFYQIDYNTSDMLSAEIKTADIFIRVFENESTNNQLLGESPLYFNVSDEFTLNFKLDHSEYRGEAEFDQIIAQISPLLEGQEVKFWELREDETHQDISFLAGETGWPANQLALIPTAFQLFNETDIPAAILYGLFRLQFPKTPKALFSVNSQSIKNGIIAAMEANIIAAYWVEQLENILQIFKNMGEQLLLSEEEPESVELKEMLAVVLPNNTQQTAFINTFIQTEDKPEKFWFALGSQEGFDEDKIEELKQTFHINHFALGNKPLTTLLLQEGQNDPELKTVRGFAKFTKADWQGRIDELVKTGKLKEFPANISGNTPEEKTENYAAVLNQFIKDAYPTEVFNQRLLSDTNHPFGERKSDLNTFFSQNPDFDLQSTQLHQQWSEVNLGNIQEVEALKKELKTINRLSKLNPDYEHIRLLKGLAIDAATTLVQKYSKKEFTETFKQNMGEEVAREVYEKAQQTDRRATAILMKLKTQQDVKLFAINGPAEHAPTTDIEDTAFTYQGVFGDNNLCECEHCQSVYSPAAYFVDLLHFMKQNNEEAFSTLVGREADTVNNITEKIGRRPDLQHILLNCQNTNTPLPYIDLVNEILENQIAPPDEASDTENGNENDGNTTYQTTLTASELDAFPEHTNEAAYEKLKTADASFHLPFNLPLEESRLYLSQLNIERHEIMRLFYGKKGVHWLNDIAIAAEYLGFSKQELELINGTTSLSTLPPLDNENIRVSAFLASTGLSYLELLQLLETYFINPVKDDGERSIFIVARTKEEGEDDIPIYTCNPDNLVFQGIETDTSDKIMRFLRLWKKTGWSMTDLDRVFGAFKIQNWIKTPDEINQKLIIPLAHTVRLKNEYHLEVENALIFWGTFDQRKYYKYELSGRIKIPSLYEKLFLNRQIYSPVDTDFEKLFEGENANLTLSDKADLIAATFKISLGDFQLLIDVLEKLGNTPDENQDLTLVNLGTFYRYVLTSRVLGMPISDVLFALDLIGNVDFQNLFPLGASLKLLDKLSWLQSTPFSWLELKELLTNQSAAINALQTSLMAETLNTLREGLRKIASQFPDAATITEEAEKMQKNQQIFIAETFSTAFNANVDILGLVLMDLVKSANDHTKAAIEAFLEPAFIESIEPLFSPNEENEVVWAFPNLVDTVNLLNNTWQRIDKLLGALNLSVKEFLYFNKHKADFGLTGIWTLPISETGSDLFAAFENLVNFANFKKALHTPSEDWYLIFETIKIEETDAKTEFIASLAPQHQMEIVHIEALLGSNKNDMGILQYDFSSDYYNGSHLLNLLYCLNLSRQLGTSPMVLNELAQEDLSSTQVAKSLLKSKYDETAWLSVLRPISNQIRERKRTALLAYLLYATDTENFRTTNTINSVNDLYAHFLIDMEMSACMKTSRIKQAISSVQLFIDRCLMNLEAGVELDNDFANQWNKWRKIYRVWEANRKIFLYPENWIEPELRDDKTPFFKTLEKKLKQNEVTDEIAEDALMQYLEDLDKVANLEIIGFFADEETNIVHVIGRTKNIPHHYYYRKEENQIWTAWEKIDLDIEGDHILPVVWNGRLYLFWGVFEEKQEEQPINLTISGGVNDGNISSSSSPQKYWEMNLVWSEYRNEKWNSKKISSDSSMIYVENIASISLNSFYLDSGLSIGIFQFSSFELLINPPRGTHNISLLSSFNFNNCNDTVQIKNNDIRCYSINNNLRGDAMFWKRNLNYPFKLFETNFYKDVECGFKSLPSYEEETIFEKTPKEFQMLPYHSGLNNQKSISFFYSSLARNFYSKSSKKHIIDIPDIDITTTVGAALKRKYNNFTSTSIFENVNTTPVVLSNSEEVVENPTSSIDENSNNSSYTSFFNYKNFYHFKTFYFPYTCEFIKNLNTSGIEGFYQNANQNRPSKIIFTQQDYNPTNFVLKPFPVEEVDFSVQGTYSIYNWELFFHIPLYMATRLSENQKFAEARKWFHYIFDPTQPDNGQGPARFWKTKPFIEEFNAITTIDSIQEILENNGSNLQEQIQYWEQNPFNPHAVARMRTAAYMRTTVMKYIDNLIAWGDQLFRRDSIESINEATLLYVLAANLLGKRPDNIPLRAVPQERSFFKISDDLGENSFFILTDIENLLPPSKPIENDAGDNLSMPFFCIPKNQKLLTYWDTIADRLFKIRNCMNIEGVVRQLPLFEPPIDPALLVRAAAAGLDLNNILNDISVQLPNYRFQIMLNKANELCNDVKNLGAQLLSVLEKQDAEELALLRSGQELKLLDLIFDIRERQKEEAKEQLAGLKASRKVIEERKQYYESREFMNAGEQLHFASVNIGLALQLSQSEGEILAGSLYANPDLKVGGPFTAGTIWGGINLGNAANSSSSVLGILAAINNTIGIQANTLGGYKRREDDWKFQAKTANLELRQIDRQIAAAEIRLAITEREMEQHRLQMENTQEIDEFLQSKFTNAELYHHMTEQVSSLYFQSYQMAYELAKQAEKCFQVELGIETSNYIKFGYWNSLKKGLLSGEKLQVDLRRLDLAYMEQNKRDYEITKHISLRQLDPMALLNLRATGACTIDLPEWLFDMDCPGHYMRRIKSVALSIPAIAGPYTGVNCTLTMTHNSVRLSPIAGEEYANTGSGDTRFKAYHSSTKSIVTSSGQNDSGLFEVNLRDERYLPFEGMGAISKWSLKLPETVRQFNYNTITDVILHIRYMAKEGGDTLKTAAIEELTNLLEELDENNNGRMEHLFSLRHDFPQVWHQFKKSKDGNLKLNIQKDHFPYLVQAGSLENFQIQLYPLTRGEKPEPLLDSVISQALDDFNIEGKAEIEIARDAIGMEADEIFLIIGYTFSV